MSDKEQRGIVEEVRNIIESYSVPDTMELEEPGTGVKALVQSLRNEAFQDARDHHAGHRERHERRDQRQSQQPAVDGAWDQAHAAYSAVRR